MVKHMKSIQHGSILQSQYMSCFTIALLLIPTFCGIILHFTTPILSIPEQQWGPRNIYFEENAILRASKHVWWKQEQNDWANQYAKAFFTLASNKFGSSTKFSNVNHENVDYTLRNFTASWFSKMLFDMSCPRQVNRMQEYQPPPLPLNFSTESLGWNVVAKIKAGMGATRDESILLTTGYSSLVHEIQLILNDTTAIDSSHAYVVYPHSAFIVLATARHFCENVPWLAKDLIVLFAGGADTAHSNVPIRNDIHSFAQHMLRRGSDTMWTETDQEYTTIHADNNGSMHFISGPITASLSISHNSGTPIDRVVASPQGSNGRVPDMDLYVLTRAAFNNKGFRSSTTQAFSSDRLIHMNNGSIQQKIPDAVSKLRQAIWYNLVRAHTAIQAKSDLLLYIVSPIMNKIHSWGYFRQVRSAGRELGTDCATSETHQLPIHASPRTKIDTLDPQIFSSGLAKHAHRELYNQQFITDLLNKDAISCVTEVWEAFNMAKHKFYDCAQSSHGIEKTSDMQHRSTRLLHEAEEHVNRYKHIYVAAYDYLLRLEDYVRSILGFYVCNGEAHQQSSSLSSFNIDSMAVDLQAEIIPGPNKQKRSNRDLAFIGSGIERWIRMVNGLEERMHAGYRLFALLGPDHFTSGTETLLHGVILHLPFLYVWFWRPPQRAILTQSLRIALLASLFSTLSYVLLFFNTFREMAYRCILFCLTAVFTGLQTFGIDSNLIHTSFSTLDELQKWLLVTGIMQIICAFMIRLLHGSFQSSSTDDSVNDIQTCNQELSRALTAYSIALPQKEEENISTKASSTKIPSTSPWTQETSTISKLHRLMPASTETALFDESSQSSMQHFELRHCRHSHADAFMYAQSMLLIPAHILMFLGHFPFSGVGAIILVPMMILMQVRQPQCEWPIFKHVIRVACFIISTLIGFLGTIVGIGAVYLVSCADQTNSAYIFNLLRQILANHMSVEHSLGAVYGLFIFLGCCTIWCARFCF